MKWYLEVLRKYAVFSGRAGRAEYWMFALINVLISIAIAAVDVALGFQGGATLSSLYSIAVLLPGLGVSVRRLHDIGRTGWWILLAFVPIVGWVVLLVFMASQGQSEENEYGPTPSAVPA